MALLALVLGMILRAVAGAQPLARHELPVSMWRKGSKNCLSKGDAACFERSRASGDCGDLLCQVGGVISAELPGRVPRKELFEAFAVAELVERHFPEQREVVDFCAGCGLLGLFLALLKPGRKVRCSDKKRPAIARRLQATLARHWPHLSQVSWEEEDIRYGNLQAANSELVTACHACSFLSDEVLFCAIESRSPVVLLPCCYEKVPALPERPWLPKWSWKRWPWLEGGAVNRLGRMAIHRARTQRLAAAGFEVAEDFIDPEISNMNLAIVARPAETH